jgi:hypothetical protein
LAATRSTLISRPSASGSRIWKSSSTDQLARLLLLHTVDLDLLDDHVAAAHGGDDGLGLRAGAGERGADRVGDDAGVHDLALDDRIREQRRDRHLHELGLAAAVVDDRDLDETGADVEADRCLLLAEERHGERRLGGSENARGAPRASEHEYEPTPNSYRPMPSRCC